MKRIPIEPTFAAWRRAARALLRQGIEPGLVEWVEVERDEAEDRAVVAERDARLKDVVGSAGAVASAGSAASTATGASNHPSSTAPSTPAIPRELLGQLQTAACYRAADRWALLYRILWRWTHGERDVIELHDPDGAQLNQRVQSIEHETADLLDFTLFRRRDPSIGLPEFVGWYEPRHDLLERAAEKFAKPMGDSTWMLATPHGAAFWNGMLLRIDQTAAKQTAAQREQATPALPPDAMTGEAITSEPTEALWLAYYASVFNARPTPMPLRYWRTPPAGPPLPAQLARERSRAGAQDAVITVPETAPVEDSALTPPLHEPTGPLATCRRCALWRNAKQAVAGVGSADATIMAVGEQPGEYENQHGEPFTGPAGQLLDAVLARAGLERATLYLTYAVKHYKWETFDQQRVHRMPERREVEACEHWLQQELTRVEPRAIVTLGATALKALTGAHVNLSEYLGQTIAHRGRLIVPTWHPSYALRTADARLREDIVEGIVTAFSRAAALAAQGG
ncbi:UdgX family uracil-DNA binding protein [Paraburkholderia ginsengisoli]|uniref:Type-4 uracil-DNA glycosylase n=1 Tax=Paraburkholderia ginsengisoli TaxID=311231 RepID=A0A7T4N8E1_9BURK|nr:UdgX family uracil-DNA binding protein [Paraburkholderia ginsengisoli]QQC67116.1 UdgX family uracil-DNA binding protein [Paraburkholderia ginsengisoli]